MKYMSYTVHMADIQLELELIISHIVSA